MSRQAMAAAKLRVQIEKAMRGATPSLHMSVLSRGENVFRAKLGEVVTYFDLASLTKVIFATSRLMTLVSEGKLELHSPVSRYLPWFRHPTLISDLLTHTAGFRWWHGYYQDLDLTLPFHERWMQLQMRLRDEEPVLPVSKAVYSDVDFLLLGAVLEAIEKRRLIEIWKDHGARMKSEKLHFCVDNQPPYPRKLYAPTEICPWRLRVMQGEVHDENTWALGGVSSHAGLFGRLEDVEHWALALRGSWRGDAPGLGGVDKAVVHEFLKRQTALGDWGYGFMMPTPGSSSSGSLFSTNSFGHTGFTGTSFWWDLDRDLMVIVLANRIHPTRENKMFVQLRPEIHNWVITSFDSTGR